MAGPGPFELADLVDLEARIAEDAAADDADLADRDRPIAAQLDHAHRPTLLAGWLAALRPTLPMPGERVARALRLSRLALIVVGLATGWSTATWLLLFDGPVINVVQALVVLVGLQVALLALLALALLARRLGWSGDGDLRSVVSTVVRLADAGLRRLDDRWHDRDADQRARTRALWHRLRARRSLYRDVERTHLVATLQAFGVAFNVAAIAAIVRAASLYDLSFGWMTTLELDAAAVAGWLQASAAPWGWAWPEAVPTAELVDASRYSRRLGQYLTEVGQPLVAADVPGLAEQTFGRWWRFLVMSVAVYGFAPRLALYVYGLRAGRRALATVPLDTPDVDRIVRRLTAHRVETRAPAPEVVEEPAPRTLEPEYAAPTPAERWTVIGWRDFPVERARIDAAVGAWAGEVDETVEVPDFSAQQRVLDALGSPERILVLAETFEAPDKAVRRFLAALRASAGERCPIVVGLVSEAGPGGWRAVDGETVALWKQHLAINEDPYLGVEALEARS